MEFIYSKENPETEVSFTSFEAMHSVFEMVMTGIPEDEARHIAGETAVIVKDAESKLDRHNPDSIFAMINATGGRSEIETDDEILSILRICETFRKYTAGYFDIAALSEDRNRPAYTFSSGTGGIRLSGNDIFIDAGGFGKGYALDKVRSSLENKGITDTLVNFGDSSVMAIGKHPFGDFWDISTAYGKDVFHLRDSSLSISGPRRDGKPHIMDPIKGTQVSSQELVAVTGKSAFICEILSTALYAAPEMMRGTIMESFNGYSYKTCREDIRIWTEENL